MLPIHNSAQIAPRGATFTEKLQKNEKQKKANENWVAFAEFGCALLIAGFSLQAAWQNTHGIVATSLPSSFPTSLPTYYNTTNIHTFSENHHAMNNLSIMIKTATALAIFVALGPKNFSTFLNLRNMRQTLKEYLESNDHHIKDIQFIRYKLIVKLAVRGIFSHNPVVAEALSFRLIEEFTQAHFTQQMPAELQKALTLTRSLFEGRGYVQPRVWAISPLLLITIAVVSAVLLSSLFQPKNTTKNSIAIIGFSVSLVLALSTVLSYVLGHSEQFRSLTNISALEQAIDVIKSTEQNAELLIKNILHQLGNTNSTAVNNVLEQLDNIQAEELLHPSQAVTLLPAALIPHVNVSALGMFRHTALESLERMQLTASSDSQNLVAAIRPKLTDLQNKLPKSSKNNHIKSIVNTKIPSLSSLEGITSLITALTEARTTLELTNKKLQTDIKELITALIEPVNKLKLSKEMYNSAQQGVEYLQLR